MSQTHTTDLFDQSFIIHCNRLEKLILRNLNTNFYQISHIIDHLFPTLIQKQAVQMTLPETTKITQLKQQYHYHPHDQFQTKTHWFLPQSTSDQAIFLATTLDPNDWSNLHHAWDNLPAPWNFNGLIDTIIHQILVANQIQIILPPPMQTSLQLQTDLQQLFQPKDASPSLNLTGYPLHVQQQIRQQYQALTPEEQIQYRQKHPDQFSN